MERSSKVDYELVLDARQTITVFAVPHLYGALRKQPDETKESCVGEHFASASRL
jgi:hypothetical protein